MSLTQSTAGTPCREPTAQKEHSLAKSRVSSSRDNRNITDMKCSRDAGNSKDVSNSHLFADIRFRIQYSLR